MDRAHHTHSLIKFHLLSIDSRRRHELLFPVDVCSRFRQLSSRLFSQLCFLVRKRFMTVSWMIRTGLHPSFQASLSTGGPATLRISLELIPSVVVWTALSIRNTMSFSSTNTRGLLPRPLVAVVSVATSTDSFFSLGCFGMVPVVLTLAMGTLGPRTPPSNPVRLTGSYNSPFRGSRS